MNSLREGAIEISPIAVQVVDKKAGWNEAERVTLIESGAGCGADAMNKLGLSAEYEPWITLSVAVASILGGHLSLKAELQGIAAELRAEREKEAKARAAVPHKIITHAPT